MKKIEKYTSEDNQFYPTPESFLKQVMADFKEELNSFENEHKYDIKVLEPSAGKGDIVRFIKNNSGDFGFYSRSVLPRCDIECIEIDPTLRATLRGQDFVVVYDDFLSYETHTKYDLIFMNPPFANGDKHLLKAINLQQRYGGRILCILNASTIANPFNTSRQELKALLDKYNAKIKIYPSPFAADDSERRTDTNVAVVWVDIPTPFNSDTSLIFDKMDKADPLENSFGISGATEHTELIKMGLDWITAYVMQYEEHIKSALNFVREYEAFRTTYNARYANVEKNKYVAAFSLKVYGKDLTDINELINRIRYNYWKALFDNPKFNKKLTSKMLEDLYSRIETFQHFDFSEHNILVLMQENASATIKGIEEAIIELFDKLTQYAQYDGCSNVHYYNGWKTNAAHKLNKKIIIPFYGVWEASAKYSGTNVWNIRKCGYEYRLNENSAIYTLSDMSKTLNYLSGGICEVESEDELASAIKTSFREGNAKNIKLKHFTVTFYKKGTCHLAFNNDELLEKFNMFAAQNKGWLPPCYGKKHYSEMDEEEKAIISDFQGETAYEKIMTQKDRYLVNFGDSLALPAAAN